MASGNTRKDAPTAGENAYQRLRGSIITLQVKPGETIHINELCAYLGIGRSPVRDALIRLTKDGLVTTTPQKGTIVSKIDIQRARDERFMRACVEERVLEEFITCHADGDMVTLEAELARQRELIDSGDARGFLRADDEFHAVFFRATNHPFSLDNILNMSGHYHRIRLLSLSKREVCERSYEQHREILQIIHDKNYAGIRDTILSHVAEKKDEELFLCRKYPDLFIGGDKADSAGRKIWEEDFLMAL